MVIIQSYSLAVAMCLVTMLCWGSWANTMKLTHRDWVFPLYYWDYAVGVILFALLLAFTLGSSGSDGRAFVNDMAQADWRSIEYAFAAGVIFNLANVLLVAVIDFAGMAIAFPIGIGLALVLGVITSYLQNPVGNPWLVFGGLAGVTIAIVLDGIAYSKIPSDEQRPVTKGIIISILAGAFMGFFYPILVQAISTDLVQPEAGKLTPYSAIVVFSVGLFVSCFLWNAYLMKKPLRGTPVSFSDYFSRGSFRDHAFGIAGGFIWCAGFSLMTLASGPAGPAISYGLGQGATMIAAFWGVFIWKEFAKMPKGGNWILAAMFGCYLLGLAMLIAAKFN